MKETVTGYFKTADAVDGALQLAELLTREPTVIELGHDEGFKVTLNDKGMYELQLNLRYLDR